MSYLGRSSKFGVRSRYIYTAAGSETSITGNDDNNNALSFTDGAYVDVHLNGVLLVPGTDYNTTTANTIGGLASLAASDVLEVVVYDTFQVADTVPASTGGTFNGNITANAFYGNGANLTGLAASFDQLTDTTVSTTDPTISSNPSAAGHLWLNKTSGELYVCTNATAGANVWTNVGDGSGDVTPTYTVNYLLVAGGGGGGNWSGGAGGGAGGLLSGSTTVLGGTTYSFDVGAGGSNVSTQTERGYNGEDTTGFSLTAIGGGGGGSEGTGVKTGSNGGSGGGGSYPSQAGGSGTSGQGNSGGEGGQGSDDYTGGGGGGAGAVGQAGGSNSPGFAIGGAGGIGVTNLLIDTTQATANSVGEVSGSDVYYAGGGGGGSQDGGSPGTPGSGGIGGGGAGGAYGVSDGSNGPANTGGGGGGGRAGGSSGIGGSGVVIIKMATSRYSGTTTGSPTVVTDGSDTIVIFKSSGSYTA